jgi:hypothetical protein
MLKSVLILLACLTAPGLLGGCYSPGGGMLGGTGGPQTYRSTETMQKTITMVDVRTEKPFFGPLEIPAGKQLTIDFATGEGDDPINTPDLLQWELLEYPTKSGRLLNAMSVPNAASRRIDVTLTHAIKYANVDAQHRPLRTDEVQDRPDWWTPEGGPLPKDERTNMYDD